MILEKKASRVESHKNTLIPIDTAATTTTTTTAATTTTIVSNAARKVEMKFADDRTKIGENVCLGEKEKNVIVIGNRSNEKKIFNGDNFFSDREEKEKEKQQQQQQLQREIEKNVDESETKKNGKTDQNDTMNGIFSCQKERKKKNANLIKFQKKKSFFFQETTKYVLK